MVIAQSDNNFELIGALNKSPEVLRTAIKKLRAQHERRGQNTRFLSILEDIRSKESSGFISRYLSPDEKLEDFLFQADYKHNASPKKESVDDKDTREIIDHDDNDVKLGENDASNCRYCDRIKTVKRESRTCKIKIHYDLIAFGNAVVKDAARRDEINERLKGNVLCFEMETAGITNSHSCLAIRGICDKVLCCYSRSLCS